MLSQLAGFKMIESEHAKEEDGKMGRYIKRSWKDRLFSLPFRPFRKDKLIIVTRYKPMMYRYYDKIIFHPSLKQGIIDLSESVS